MPLFFKKIFAFLVLPEMKIALYFGVFAVLQASLVWFIPRVVAAPFVSIVNFMFLVALVSMAVKGAKTNFALKLEKRQNAAIVEGFAEGVIAYDQNFRIWSMNPAAEVICGVRKEEVLDKVVTPEWGANERYKILIQVLFPSLAPVVAKKSVAAYPHVVEVSFIEPREMHLEVTTNQTFDEGGNLLGFLKVIRDTSREVDLLRVKSEFITVAAHQLRTPLSGIKWAFEALMKGDLGKTTEEQVKTADQALKTVQRLISIVDDFLDLAKIEEGKFGYEFEKADLTTLILTALEQYEELAKEKSVHLVFYRPETPLPPLLMDPRRIRLVLQNLITNAITYNVKNGEVRVRLEWLTDRPYVQISVEDTGLGIPEKDQARLFTKFFRSDNVLRVEVGGSGLGLYISRNIVKRHGGDIWVKSIEKRGTTVTFLLPTDESLIPQVEIPTQETF